MDEKNKTVRPRWTDSEREREIEKVEELNRKAFYASVVALGLSILSLAVKIYITIAL